MTWTDKSTAAVWQENDDQEEFPGVALPSSGQSGDRPLTMNQDHFANQEAEYTKAKAKKKEVEGELKSDCQYCNTTEIENQSCS